MRLPFAGLALFLLAACAPATTQNKTVSITLPTGETCLWAGEGATLAFEGKRLTYTCGSAALGLVGELQFSGADLSVEKVTVANAEVAASEIVTGRIATVILQMGETCAFAGEGATLAVDNKCVNYTCSGDNVLLGDFNYSNGVVTVEQGVVTRATEGTVVRPSQTVIVQALTLQ
jgi:hypothetical protein